MKKILYVVPSITKNNGIITFLYNYISNKNLINEFEYTIFSSDKQDKEVVDLFKALGVKIYFYNMNLRPVKKFINSIKLFYKYNKFDIVHINLAATAYFHIKYVKRYNKEAKIIMHSHNTKLSSNKKKAIVGSLLYSLCKNKIDYRFACSAAAGKYLYKNKDFIIIYNALSNDSIIEGENLRSKYNIGSNKILVGLVGRVTDQKNPFYIFELASRLENNVFIIIGNGDRLDSMKQYALENNFNNVIFLGSVEDAKVLFYNFDFIVMPSLYEGLPLVALEAQQQHIFTILSTNITKEVEISNYSKFIPLYDLDAWVETLKTKINYRFKFNDEYDNYNIDMQATRLKNLYLDILGENYE